MTTTSRFARTTSLAVLVAVIGAKSFAQAPFPAGRPLSGSIVCRIQTTSGTAYTETQTHTWTLTGGAPQILAGELWIHPAQWTVTGSGRLDLSGNNVFIHEAWTVAGGPLDAPIAIRSRGTDLAVELYHTPAQVSDGITGATTTFGGGANPAPFPFRAPTREAPLPPIQGPRLSASLTGSTSATITGQFPIYRQPAGTDVVESCTWQLAPAGGQSSLPPPPNSPAPQQTAQVDATGRRGANASAAAAAPAPTGPVAVAITVPLLLGASPADGPWSGQAQCVLSATAPGYQDEQTHTWKITGGPPKLNGIFRQWPAVWSVRGNGSRRVGTPAAAAGGSGGQQESWTYEVRETSAPIAIWEVAAGRIRIGSQHGLLVANAAMTGRTLTPGTGTAFAAAVQEWAFPVVEDTATNTTISPTPRTRTVPQLAGWRQPSNVMTTETCTWNFTRGATTPDLSSSTGTRGDLPTVAGRRGAAEAVLAPTPAPTSQTIIEPLPAGGTLASASAVPTSKPAPVSPPPADTLARPAGTGPLPGSVIVPANEATLTTVQCTTTGPQATTTVTPGGVTFRWPSVSGATGYSVSRRDLGALTTTPVTALTYTHTAALDYRNAPYQYTLTALFADGRCATTNVAVTGPKPLAPKVTATVTESNMVGRVHLSWGAQADKPSSYLVLGPNLHEAGAEVTAGATEQSIDIEKLTAGTYEWLVTPFWKTPTGVMSDVTSGARVTVKVAFSSGKYRISLAGFRVNHPTYDDQLSLDGQGDEVYAAATVSQWRRQLYSALVSNDTVKSEVYRGLTTGGVAPSGFDPSQAPGGAGSKTRFPLVLWEGVLGNDVDVVVVHPTLWELDGDPTVFEHWKGNTSGGAASNYFWFKDMNSSAIFEHKYDYPTDIYQFSTAAQFVNEQEPFSSNSTRPQRIYPGRDRPIGLDDYHQNVVLEALNYSRIYWSDREYTFTRAKIEALLNAPSAGVAPGMVAVQFVDGDPHHAAGRLDGNYTLYFYVQRIP